jgi:hypothetical protein
MPTSNEVKALIATVAPLYHLDTDLVTRLCGALSGFDVTAPEGLMRIEAAEVPQACSVGAHWKRNVQAGIIRFRALLDEFAGDTEKALAAYYFRDSRRVHRAVRQYETAWMRHMPRYLQQFVEDCVPVTSL